MGDIIKNDQRKFNTRLRLIFENGTESKMLLRSLVDGLHANDGRLILEKDTNDNYSEIKNDDTETGYIYILKSLSTNTRISNLKNLFKIGFSTTSVETRIVGAEKDPTYLMSSVSIISTYKVLLLQR